MDIFSKVKRAFGFTEDGSDYEEDIRAQHRSAPYVNPFRNQKDDEQQSTATTAPATGDDVAALKAQLQQLTTLVRTLQQSPQAVQASESGASQPVAPAADNDELKQRLHESEAQRRAAQTRANSLTEKIEDMQVRITTLENDKKGLLNKIRVMQVKAGGDGSTDTTDAIEKMMEQHHEELAEKDQQIDQLTSQLSQAQEQLKEIGSKFEGAEHEATISKDELTQLRQQLIKSEEQLEDTTRVVAVCREELAQKNEQIKQLKDELARLGADDSSKERLQQVEQENVSLHKTIDQLNALAKETAETHRRRDIDVGNHIDALKAQLNSAASVVERQRSEHDQLNQQIKSLTTSLESQQQKQREKDKAADELRASLIVANAQIEQLTSQSDQLNTQIQELTAGIAKLNTENEQLKHEIQELSTRQQPSVQDEMLTQAVSEKVSAAEERLETSSINFASQETSVAEDYPTPELADVEQVLHKDAEVTEVMTPGPAEVTDSTKSAEVAENHHITIEADDTLERVLTQEANPVADHTPNLVEAAEDADAVETESHSVLEHKPSSTSSSTSSRLADIEENLDDIDWLMPSVPDKPAEPEPEPEPEPTPAPKSESNNEPRQLSLF